MGRDRGSDRDRPGSNYNEGPKIGIGPGSIFRARDQIGTKILGIDPSLISYYLEMPLDPVLENCSNIVYYNSPIMYLLSIVFWK